MRRTDRGQRCRARRQVSSIEDTGCSLATEQDPLYIETVRREESVGARLLMTAHVYSTRDIVDVIYVISCTGD